MNENWKFSDIPYHRPDVEALQARYDALTRRAREARSPEELVEIVRQRDALQQEVGLCQAVAFIRAFHDVTDEFYQTELQETMETLEYKCWFYEAAQEAGTVAAPQSMTVENIPEEHRKTYRRLKELVE